MIGSEACKRRENPEGEDGSLMTEDYMYIFFLTNRLRLTPADPCVFSSYLRRQFCCERLPPERDGGVREVQRHGAQAEEHAGTRLTFKMIITSYLLEINQKEKGACDVPLL